MLVLKDVLKPRLKPSSSDRKTNYASVKYPSTKIAFNLSSGLDTSCCSRKTTCWRPALGWGP